MKGSFASGANAYLVVKIFLDYCRYKSSPVDRFWCLRCLNNRIKVPDIAGSFTSGATASQVAKKGTKNYLSHLKTDFVVKGI